MAAVVSTGRGLGVAAILLKETAVVICCCLHDCSSVVSAVIFIEFVCWFVPIGKAVA